VNGFEPARTLTDMRLSAAARIDRASSSRPNPIIEPDQGSNRRPGSDAISSATANELPLHRSVVDSSEAAAATFTEFVLSSRTDLQRAITSHHGVDLGLEALAEAYAYAWANWDRIWSMDNPVGYVFRVADRVAIRLAKRQRLPDELRSGDPSALTDPTPWGADPSLAARSEVLELLSSLPAPQRAAVLLVHGYGYSYGEAARLLGIPLTTLTNHLIRGSRRLRSTGRSL
jgi:DNA-directed RNA polymerase specialized sigma24 family protein